MLQFNHYQRQMPSEPGRGCHSTSTGPAGSRPLEARVKLQWAPLYPGVDPKQWYPVVQEGEYKDDMEGLWIQVTERVTYVLAKHFDLQARAQSH